MSRKLLASLTLAALAVLAGVAAYMLSRPGHEALPSPIKGLVVGKPETIRVWSPVFGNGSRIPTRYTCDGRDASIPLRIEGVPGNARSLLLIMYDPDAPGGTFYHWILYNIPPNTTELPEGLPRAPSTMYGLQGVNDFGRIGYGGPCPPIGGGSHRYFIIVLALDKALDLPPGAKLGDVVGEAWNHVVAYGLYMGTYSR